MSTATITATKDNGAQNKMHRFLVAVLVILAFSIVVSSLTHFQMHSMNKTLTDSEASIHELHLDNDAEIVNKENEPKEQKEPKEQNHKFAYVYLIAGIDPSAKMMNYRGYIYSVAVSAYLFKTVFQSKHDVIVMIRMHANTDHTELPKYDADILHKCGIIVKYLPKPKVDNFHTAMMDKFRILELEEYSRVMYLDADVIPLNNLDYVFELSVMKYNDYNISGIKELEGIPEDMKKYSIVQENIGLSSNNEPINGGLFVMKPNKTDYQALLDVVERREREGYHFNETLGWGHIIREDDPWECVKGPKGNKWNMYGAFTDQGLVYYWTKYVKKHVTLINASILNTWVPNITDPANPTPQLVYSLPSTQFFNNHYPLVPKKNSFNVSPNHHAGKNLPNIIPYRDFHHFKEHYKPWLKKGNNKKGRQDHGPQRFWYKTLKKVNEEWNLGLVEDLTNKLEFNKPDLGLFPTNKMVEDMKQVRDEESV